ncbi:hypothetical protein Tco_1101911 [Tanacetum coccineum]
MDLKLTKLTMGNAIVKLVKKVKKLEGFMKRRNLVLTDSEEEEPEAQGRKSEDDPLDSSVQGLVTPPTTKVNTLGEEQVEEIRKEIKRRKRLKEEGSLSLDFQEEVDAGADRTTRRETLLMSSEDDSKEVKRTNFREEVSLAEAIRLDTLQKKRSQRKIDKLVKQKYGKRRKQMARKGMHTSVDKNDSEDSDEVGEQEESTTGTETPINPVPVAMKTPSVATYKIIKQGEKGVYQIVREDGTDIVYINFGAIYGMDGPEDKLEKGFWKCLRIMFEEPLSTDPIWSELGQQKIISWRYYDTFMSNYAEMKLLDGKMSEDCYRLLKMMEKQAGIRK